MKSLPSYRARNYQTTVFLPGKEIKMRLDTRNVIFQNKFIDNVVSICLLALEYVLNISDDVSHVILKIENNLHQKTRKYTCT